MASGVKPVVAVDVDEVLAQFVPALVQWHNRVHGTELSVETFFSQAELKFKHLFANNQLCDDCSAE
jgi:hypothetical protein